MARRSPADGGRRAVPRGCAGGQEQSDELAILCLLAWPAAKIVAVVLEFQGRLRGVTRRLGGAEALDPASSPTFMDSLADAELLQDMQAIVVADSAG